MIKRYLFLTVLVFKMLVCNGQDAGLSKTQVDTSLVSIWQNMPMYSESYDLSYLNKIRQDMKQFDLSGFLHKENGIIMVL